ncbi:MAG: hypothetical protein L0338_33450 [Acidobacteria bacterium]|nr:hypothetical protein [Acidobacteriota bacterium]
MRPIGFSTGALAFGDYRRGLKMIQARRIRAVELSALREGELEPLLSDLDSLDLSDLDYVSFHAPSALEKVSEERATVMLRQLLPRRWPIILHPDVIKNRPLWSGFGEWLCIENMDKRKPIGRTVAELEPFFRDFPDASFCFDIGHARQVDPTMSEAALLLRRFADRLKQVHMSEVNSRSKHDAISFTAMQSFHKVADLIPPGIPIILETVIPEDQILEQLQLAAAVFR